MTFTQCDRAWTEGEHVRPGKQSSAVGYGTSVLEGFVDEADESLSAFAVSLFEAPGLPAGHLPLPPMAADAARNDAARLSSVLALLDGPADEKRYAGLLLLPRLLPSLAADDAAQAFDRLGPAFFRRMLAAGGEHTNAALAVLAALPPHDAAAPLLESVVDAAVRAASTSDETALHDALSAAATTGAKPSAIDAALIARSSDDVTSAIHALANTPWAPTDTEDFQARSALEKLLRTPPNVLPPTKRHAALRACARLAATNPDWLGRAPPTFVASVAAVLRAEGPVLLGEATCEEAGGPAARALCASILPLFDELVAALGDEAFDDDDDDDDDDNGGGGGGHAVDPSTLLSLEAFAKELLAFILDDSAGASDLVAAIVYALAGFLRDCPLALGVEAPPNLDVLLARAHAAGGAVCAASLVPYASQVAEHPPADASLRRAAPQLAALLREGGSLCKRDVLEALAAAFGGGEH